MKKKNVCIVGAGIAGLTAGALLTKQGYNVTIFEKESRIGGRALSLESGPLNLDEYKNLLTRFHMNIAFSEPILETIFEKMFNGYKLDLGYHAIGGALSNVNHVLSELEDNIGIIESRVGLITENGYIFPFTSKLDKLKILPNILRLLFTSEKALKELDSVSIAETIITCNKGKMKLMLEIFSRSIATMNNLNKISTGEMIRAQRNLYRGSKPVGYPKNGLESIHQKLADYIIKHGGEIHLNTLVNKIFIKENMANGISTDDKKYSFDIILSNILVQDLFKIVDEKHFPDDYVKYIKSLEGTGSLCAYYSLRKLNPDLIGKTFHFIERNVGVEGNDAVGMIDFMSSSPEAGLSPPGSFLVQSYIICTPYEAKNPTILKKLKYLLDKNLEILVSNYKEKLNWAIYPAIWHLDGVAKTIDNEKPSIETPIKNLYLVGDCVKSPGIGLNCAINSARIFCDDILKK